jgi:hypothetical protein
MNQTTSCRLQRRPDDCAEGSIGLDSCLRDSVFPINKSTRPRTLQILDEASVDEHAVEMARLCSAGTCVEQTLAAREDFLLFEE